jgi:hypothetical protein
MATQNIVRCRIETEPAKGFRSLLGLDYGELLVFVVSLEAKPENCGLDASGFG